MEKVFLISIEFSVFDEIQCLPQVFLKILKLFSRTFKKFNSFEIKNNLIVIFILIDFEIDCNIDYFNRFFLFLKSTFKIDLQVRLISKIEKID